MKVEAFSDRNRGYLSPLSRICIAVAMSSKMIRLKKNQKTAVNSAMKNAITAYRPPIMAT